MWNYCWEIFFIGYGCLVWSVKIGEVEIKICLVNYFFYDYFLVFILLFDENSKDLNCIANWFLGIFVLEYYIKD